MRDVMLIALIVVSVALAVMLHSQSAALKNLQQKADPTLLAPNLELQQRCADRAAEVFKQEGLSGERFADFTNHYSAKLGRCFVVIHNSSMIGKAPSTSKSLSDAFEGKVYGSYGWINSQGKKYWEVAPSECVVTLPSGDEKKCQSSEEWDELVKAYMEMI